MALIDTLKEEQKLAMKAKDKPRLGTIRLALSAIKQREVDEQITLGDDDDFTGNPEFSFTVGTDEERLLDQTIRVAP